MSFRSYDPKDLSRRDLYAAMTHCIVPRPIGWTSTLSSEGVANLAPFSFFGGITSDPFTVMLSVGRRRGQMKDTACNLLATREAVIHIPNASLAAAMVQTSAEVEADVDEFSLAQLRKIPSEVVAPPRIAVAAVALEAMLSSHQEVGNGPVDMFLMEVVRFHVAEAVVGENGWPDPDKLKAVGRLGGPSYAIAAPTFAVERPSSKS